MRTRSGFWSVLFSFWAATAFSAGYALSGYLILRAVSSGEQAQAAIKFFIFGYGGLLAGTACATMFLMSIFVLPMVPNLIEEAISGAEIDQTNYRFWRRRFESPYLGLSQFGTYFLGGFAIYNLLEFPTGKESHLFFIIFTGLQYGFGGFVGRKLWCIGHMLRTLEDVNPKKEILEMEAFPRIVYIVNIFTFLTLIMTIVHTYFHAEINYITNIWLTEIAKSFVYIPVILAIPVIILFNFYPRLVINRLYLKSIRQNKAVLARMMQHSGETEFSKLKYSIDYEKYLNEEFRYRQRVALSELPVALTIVLAVTIAAVRILAN